MMKWVFLALLAINASYLAWGLLFGAPPTHATAPLPATEPGVPPLTLLSERPPEPPAMPPHSIAPPSAATPATPPAQPSAQPSAARPAPAQPMAESRPAPLVSVAPAPLAEVVPTPLAARSAGSGAAAPPIATPSGLPQPVRIAPSYASSVCYSFGPFPKSFLASKATVRLEEMGAKVERRSVRDRQQVGYWIYLPPLESKQAAVRKTQELAAKKIEDFFIVLASRYENAISLGVYKNRHGAEKRLEELRQSGFEPVMEPRYQPINVYWLDVSGVLNERQWSAVREEYPAQRRETIACPAG
ncbi:hypothetical protein [Endothiovibrio diazotrophicus]